MALRDVVKKVVEAPRHATEKVEEVREKAAQAYHDKREEPVRQSAQQRYEEKHAEAREKLKHGDISRELYEKRNARYLKQRDTEALPAEQRIAKSAKEVAHTVAEGAKPAIEKFKEDYRAGPQPKFGKSRGVKASASARSSRTTSRKSSGQPDFSRSPINFGSGNAVNFGGSSVDFGKSTLGGGGGMKLGNGGAIDFSAPLFGKKRLP